MMRRLATYVGIVLGAACGSGTARPPADAGADTAAPIDAADGGAVFDAITDIGGDIPPGPDASHDGAPTIADLEGAWHADPIAQDGGPPLLRRRRFADGTYYEVTSTLYGTCAETGSFDLTSAGVSFVPQRVVGGGSCVLGATRVETVAWTDSGISFDDVGSLSSYTLTRADPKMFATPETHNGNFAGDTALPGSTPIAKADAFCNASLARPDGLAYKALLVDGVSRSALPAIDWVFLPSTTYFRADGVLNLFYTNAAGLSNPSANNPADVYSGGLDYQWSGLSFDFTVATKNDCQGWTSASTADGGGMADAASTNLFFSSVGGVCSDPYGLLCVSQ